jgi:hypothetical protein
MIALVLKRLDSLLLTIWVGGILAIGYVVTPVLFATLDDRSLAALVAGKLFSIMAVIGLYCGSLLLFLLAAGGESLKRFRSMFMLWLIFELAGRFSNLPGLYVGIVYLVIFAGFLNLQRHTGYFRHWQFWALLGMVLLTAIGYLYLTPSIEAMRQSGEAAHASSAFKVLHGTASVLYLLTSVAGLALVVIGLPQKQITGRAD